MTINQTLLSPDVQEFIQQNELIDIPKFLLSKPQFTHLNNPQIAEQIIGRKIARTKLPSWYEKENILYPPKLNLEQTSSEQAANHKAGLVGGKKLLDLTGGFGVDSFAFSKRFDTVYHLEQNQSLSEIAKHNFKILEADNVKSLHVDGVEFLKNTQKYFEVIYLDPSRRDDLKNKVFLLEDCEPNFLELLPLLKSKSERILLKTSPLLDLKLGLEQMNTVSRIWIVGIKNEVKELLWEIGSQAMEPIVNAIHLSGNNTIEEFSFTYSEEAGCLPSYQAPQRYLYEPNASLMKSGAYGLIAQRHDLQKLHPNTHLYTSIDLKTFSGRVFEIKEVLQPNKKHLKRWHKKRGNITTRNFPMTVAEIRKKFQIHDGGEDYLFFTTDLDEGLIVVFCKKITHTPTQNLR